MYKVLYFLFFLSGLASLIYEVVWGRLLVLIFGSTTNSIVAVIAAFLAGLAFGSLFFGKVADRLSSKRLIKTYALLELGIGITGVLTSFLLPFVKNFYALFSDGSSVTSSLLLIKFSLSILVLTIPTILMGGTLPILVRIVQLQKENLGKSVSFLYSVNTFGAAVGVLISAFILIELVGLQNTIFIAVAINSLIAFVVWIIPWRMGTTGVEKKFYVGFTSILSPRVLIVILSFMASGLISIAYEVLWVRALTPTIGTFIYSFAAILAIYLVGIALGSLFYGRFAKTIKGKNLAFAVCELGIGFFALVSVFIFNSKVIIEESIEVLVAILPATIFMGLSFPAVVSLIGISKHSGKVVGLSYFGNTIGSITGGFLASFLFIPVIGTTQSIVFLSILNFAIASIFIFREERIASTFRYVLLSATLILALFNIWLLYERSETIYPNFVQSHINWAIARDVDFMFEEDESASVFGFYDEASGNYELLIDGVQTTKKVGETKLMGHIPILLHNNPRDVLVIAFGMGTTYRTSLSYGLKTDAVELVSSVPHMMRLFHDDAEEVLKDENGRIIINDGRNYVFLTDKKYDIVTIDPPPPINASGTAVLYSKEFYQKIAEKLKPGGIVSQWIWFDAREDDISMLIKSFVDVYPYVLAFQPPSGRGGVFLEGSFSPFTLEKSNFERKIANKKAKKDLAEFYKNLSLEQVLNLVIGDRDKLLKWVGNAMPVTDDYPKTEYFFLRHNLTKSRNLRYVPVSSLLQ